MAKDLQVDLELDDNLNGTLVIACPECSRRHKRPLRHVAPGSEFRCSCGFSMTFRGDDLRRVQRELDNFKRTLQAFGK